MSDVDNEDEETLPDHGCDDDVDGSSRQWGEEDERMVGPIIGLVKVHWSCVVGTLVLN